MLNWIARAENLEVFCMIADSKDENRGSPFRSEATVEAIEEVTSES